MDQYMRIIYTLNHRLPEESTSLTFFLYCKKKEKSLNLYLVTFDKHHTSHRVNETNELCMMQIKNSWSNQLTVIGC